MTQQDALDILKLGHNVYLTGPAGSGKTYVLNRYISYLREHGVEIGITASTGIAATHMNGTTIHSWCGIGIRDSLSEKDLKDLLKKPYLRTKFKSTKVLIIDEVSMLHSFRLDLIDIVCKVFKQSALPFGGMQVILCGDFFQLPPVSRDETPADFVHKSKIWDQMNLKICYLEEQHRQADPELTSLLNALRADKITPEHRTLLQSRHSATASTQATITKLYTHNIDVDTINTTHLEKIPEILEVFTMKDKQGDGPLLEILKKSCLAPEMLLLKKGALVMFIKNNFEQGYVNGTLGHVIGFNEDSLPVIKTLGGIEVLAEPASWTIEEQGVIKAEITQIPLRLAWAITVHKSQGMSLDAAEIDLSKSFVPGMGYVALSRVRTLNGLILKGLNEMALKVDPNIITLDAELFIRSEGAVMELENSPAKERAKKQKDYLLSLKKPTSDEFLLF